MIIISDSFFYNTYGDAVANYLLEKAKKLNVVYILQRKSKVRLGSFRYVGTWRKKGEISVARNLHPDLMLIVLCHELAHAVNWRENRDRKKPHGASWKKYYSDILKEISEIYSFSPKWKEKVLDLINKPRATFVNNNKSPQVFGEILLFEIDDGAVFEYNGQLFFKQGLRRSRYLCVRKKDGREYAFSAHVSVKKIN